jgi:hypothetical protein
VPGERPIDDTNIVKIFLPKQALIKGLVDIETNDPDQTSKFRTLSTAQRIVR